MSDERMTLDINETIEQRIDRYTEMGLSDARALLECDTELSTTMRIAKLAVIEETLRNYYRELLEGEADTIH